MKTLTETDFISSKWSGGTTTQLFIFPQGATVNERNFDWRISSAIVETEESDFTLFEGYERILIPLKGKLEMEHQTPNGTIQQNVGEFELARFSGSWPTKGKGKLTDFNVIFKPNYYIRVQVTHFLEEEIFVMEENTHVLFLQAGSCNLNGELLHAPALIVIEEGDEALISCSADSRIISMEIDLVG